MTRLCVFCGSSPGTNPAYMAAARRVGAAMAQRGVGIVNGGGSVGMMGEVADAALEGGGEVIGVIPEFMVGKELAHAGLTRLEVVASMHERKARMAELSAGFIALPGGIGTLEEICEMLTWSVLGVHPKPSALLNVEGYFDPLLAFLDRSVAEEFLKPKHRALLWVETDPEALIGRMLAAGAGSPESEGLEKT